MRTFIILALIVVLAGCSSSYQQFYKSYVDARTLEDVELLKPNEDPKIYSSNDFDRDIKAWRSKQYIPIGYSSFNGEYEGEFEVKAQAKRVGATLVLVNTKYTNTLTTTSTMYLPSSTRTYHSGSVYGGGTRVGYSGTNTTYGYNVVPVTTEEERYNQTAIFFVKSTKKRRIGIDMVNLSDEQRHVLERNTGATIDVVVEGTPAFYSNVLPGDILIKVNELEVRNAQHALELIQQVSPSARSVVFTVIRNGKEREITIKFDKN
jgi:serine protease Do